MKSMALKLSLWLACSGCAFAGLSDICGPGATLRDAGPNSPGYCVTPGVQGSGSTSAGSGTTGLAAAKNNRNYLLIDQYPEAIALIQQRLIT